MDTNPRPDRHNWYLLLALFVLGALALSVWQCDRDENAYERSRQDEYDRRHGR